MRELLELFVGVVIGLVPFIVYVALKNWSERRQEAVSADRGLLFYRIGRATETEERIPGAWGIVGGELPSEAGRE